MFCLKCEVPLCCHGKRNCFLTYHTEENYQIVCLPEYLQSHLGLDSQSEIDPDDLEERENTQEGRENTQKKIEKALKKNLIASWTQVYDHVHCSLVTSSILWIVYII